MKISAKIIVFNEEDNIAAVCESLDWADEIVVVDSFSTDRTVEIARGFTEKIYFNEFIDFKRQHEFADSKAENDWVFWIDADERVTPELRDSILALKERDPETLPDGFLIGRKPKYLGRWIRHSGWYPDRVLRLYRRSASRWGDNVVHESVRVEGPPEGLSGELLHFTRRNLAEHHDVISRYSRLAAEFRFGKGERAGWGDFLFKPPAAFLESYVLKQGFRDGVHGLLIAYFRAYSVFLRTAYVWEMQRNESQAADQGSS